MIHVHSHSPRRLNHDRPAGPRRCDRCDRPLTPAARRRLCRACRRQRPERLELVGYRGPGGLAPPVTMDPGRQERIARYTARAAARLPLFG